MSDSLMTANISPSVPFSSVKSALRASAIDELPARRPTLTLMPVPAERVAQVLRLRRPLRSPADHADLLDAGERLGQQREQVTAAFDDLLACDRSS